MYKRQVYDFFGAVFGLDPARADEERLTVEKRELLLLFGTEGEALPAEAIRTVGALAPWFDAEAVAGALRMKN